jgi:hypothetical protein
MFGKCSAVGKTFPVRGSSAGLPIVENSAQYGGVAEVGGAEEGSDGEAGEEEAGGGGVDEEEGEEEG